MRRKCCVAASPFRHAFFTCQERAKPRAAIFGFGQMAPSVAAIVVAAGRGLRAGGSDLPKQYRQLAGEPVIRSSLALFAWHGEVGAVQAVIHPEDRGPYEAA